MRISDDEVESILGFDDTRFPTPEGLEPFQMRPQTFAGTLLSETFLPERAAAMRQRNITAQSLVDEEGFDDPTPVDLAALVDMAETDRVDPDPEPAPQPDDSLAGAADSVLPGVRETFGVGEPDRAPRNRRERIEQELELIKDIFGDKTKDQSRERAMNLAMIGLAIAAGQSPNAITNIAQGALAGTQAMQRAQAAAAEREDALRMQAFETVMGEEREERGFQRQLQLAQFKAGLGGEGSAFTKPTHPMNQWFTTRNQLEQQARDSSDPLWERTQEMSDAERRQFLDTMALQTVLTGLGETPETRQLAENVRSGRAGQAFSQSFASGGADTAGLSPAQSATLNAARQTLDRNPANRAEVESRLRAVGIDPSLL
jgi:hypothetical protein